MTTAGMLFAQRHPPTVFGALARPGESISAYFGIRIDAAVNLSSRARVGRDAATELRAALTDQHRFLSALLEFAGRAAFDLRIIAGPNDRLQIALLGRTWGGTNASAAEQAEDLRDTLLTTIPRCVVASEVTSRDELAALLDPLPDDALEGAIISKRVISGRPTRRDAMAEQYFSVIPLQLTEVDWDRFYQALGECPAPAVVSVGIFPSAVPPAFPAQLADITRYYRRLAQVTDVAGGTYFAAQKLASDPFAVDAAGDFQQYLRSYAERVFGIRIQVASRRLAPGMVDLLGATIAPPWSESRPNRPDGGQKYQTTMFSGPLGSRLLRDNLATIGNEHALVPPTHDHQEFLSLLANLGDPVEAACAFRLPIATNRVMPGFPVKAQPPVCEYPRITVFVSYRRDDTRQVARHLTDKLAEHFGTVFMDVGAIQPGRVFADVIEGAVNACDVLLALIGTQWVTAVDEHGGRRLDDPNDSGCQGNPHRVGSWGDGDPGTHRRGTHASIRGSPQVRACTEYSPISHTR